MRYLCFGVPAELLQIVRQWEMLGIEWRRPLIVVL